MTRMENFESLPDEIKEIIYTKWYNNEKKDKFKKIEDNTIWLLENFGNSIKVIREPFLENDHPFDYFTTHFSLSNTYLDNIKHFQSYLIEYIEFIHPKSNIALITKQLDNFFRDNMITYQEDLHYHIFSKNNIYFTNSGIDNLTKNDYVKLALSVIYNCCINRKYNKISYRILDNYCGDDEDHLDSQIYFKL